MGDINYIVLILLIAAVLVNLLYMRRIIRGHELTLMHKLYIAMCMCAVTWFAVDIPVCFIDKTDLKLIWILDSATYAGVAFLPVVTLLTTAVFANNYQTFKKKWLLLFVIPVITEIIVWTNPLHHLMYEEFGFDNADIVFGPYMMVNGIYSYICLFSAFIIMFRMAFRNRSALYYKQAGLFSLGIMIPVIVNMLAVLKVIELNMLGTPFSYVLFTPIIGYTMFTLHMLNIKPVAEESILDWMEDCFIIVSDDKIIVNYNKSFDRLIARPYGIETNRLLSECAANSTQEGKNIIYNLVSALSLTRDYGNTNTYEQSVKADTDQGQITKHFLVTVKPLTLDDKTNLGYIAYFRDVTQVKDSIQRLNDSNKKMMENDRLASLGQMVGGIAHNLKTPIMAISGAVLSVEDLVREADESQGDADITPDDYREIYGEVREWLEKIKASCTYMSEVITAVKEQSVNLSSSEKHVFSVTEMLSRVSLLMRHELQQGSCHLEIYERVRDEVILTGDINNLVQVVNNLVTNAIHAERSLGGGLIEIETCTTETDFRIMVKDRGTGVPEQVKKKLFKQMVTSKGANGTGLGLYVSSSTIRGKFNGKMWVEDNPGGGAVFGIDIPLDNVDFRPKEGKGDK